MSYIGVMGYFTLFTPYTLYKSQIYLPSPHIDLYIIYGFIVCIAYTT